MGNVIVGRNISVLPGQRMRLPELDNAVAVFQPRSDSRSITARWKNGELHVNVPAGTTERRALDAIYSMWDKISRKRPTVRFQEGSVMEFGELVFTFGRQSLKPATVLLSGSDLTPHILIGTDVPIDDDQTSAIISRLMCIPAAKMAPHLLLPRAKELAAQLGLRVRSWSISSGHRTLGRCSSRGEIALSSVCVFLPAELRDYIVWHELAHLSEMNHSARFHELCDRYCGGREKEYIAQLKNYNWPIIRK